MSKLIVIAGPTASGKSALAVKLAKKFRGEIVSADSRQVYKGLDIGSGKITKKEMTGVKHHLLDVASPRHAFSVARFQALATRVIRNIQKRGNVPFLVGGTGFYIQSIVDGVVFPSVKPDRSLRAQLEKSSADELFMMLKKLDPNRAAAIDAKNPRRLIRAIEIAKAMPGAPLKKNPQFEVLQIGIKKSPEELETLIAKRLRKRLNGMIIEVEKLHGIGLSYKRLEKLGLEYRYVAQYLQGSIGKTEMLQILQQETRHFAKRQMTWFKRDHRILWIKNQSQALAPIRRFLQEKRTVD